MQGVFRLHLNNDEVEPIGDHSSESLLDFEVSPDRNKLLYKFMGTAGHSRSWIFDIHAKQETSLTPLTDIVGADSSSTAFSPDSNRVAAQSMFGRHMAILNLATRSVRAFNLDRLGAVGDGELFFGLALSQAGTSILFGRRDRHQENYWAVDESSGALTPVEVQTASADDHAFRYVRDDVEIGTYCIGCDRPVPQSELALAGNAKAVVGKDGRLVVVSASGAEDLVATSIAIKPIDITPGKFVVPACGGADMALYAVFDGRYVLYSLGGTYWIYGVEERRKAVLADRPGTFLAW
jgi:hypothetical protein